MPKPGSNLSADEELSNQALSWIVRLNSGEATSTDRRRYQDWCNLSVAHTQAAAEAQALWGMAGHVHRNSETGRIEPGRKTPRVTRRQVIGGLAGAVAIGASAPWMNRQATRLLADEVTGVAELRTLEMPDHSKVILNAKSALDTEFSQGLRQVVLKQGQGYFKSSDTTQTAGFDILAGHLQFGLAVGGGADVNLNLLNGDMIVTADTAPVRVMDRTQGSVLEIAPATQARFSAEGALLSETTLDTTTASAWREGLLIAEDTSLADIVAGLRPWHPGWIVFTDEAYARILKVNGVLDLNDPAGALSALAEGLPIKLRHAGDLVTVISFT